MRLDALGSPCSRSWRMYRRARGAQDRVVEEVSNWKDGCKWASYGSPDDVFREVLRALAKFISDPTLSSRGWRRLREVDRDARTAVRRSVSDGETALRFDGLRLELSSLPCCRTRTRT